MIHHIAYEQAEDYLYNSVLPARQAWPEHYREADDRVDEALGRLLPGDEEVSEAFCEQVQASESFHLRIGFELGRRFAANGWLTQTDVCEAVLAAGGNPAQALGDIVEEDLAEVVQLPEARA